MWGVAPALFFALGFLVLGPWYANAGWFQKPPTPPIQEPQNLRDPARGAWFDESAIPDRLGPVGGGNHTRVHRPRVAAERPQPVEVLPETESQEVVDGGEVGVPEDVPVHEAPPEQGETGETPPDSGVQPPESID